MIMNSIQPSLFRVSDAARMPQDHWAGKEPGTHPGLNEASRQQVGTERPGRRDRDGDHL